MFLAKIASMNPFVITLIHGTFAPGAGWANEEDSALRQALGTAFPDTVKCRSFNWSGKNTHAAPVSGILKEGRIEWRHSSMYSDDGVATEIVAWIRNRLQELEGEHGALVSDLPPSRRG